MAVPRIKETKFEAAPVAGRKAKPTGPNKRQRLLAATQGANAHTGHNWVVTTAAQNLCIKCIECSLYAQQVDPYELLSSATRVNTDLLAGIHPHLTLNLGHQWSCSRCNAHYSVRTKVKGPLAKRGQEKGGSGFLHSPGFPVLRVLLLYLLVELFLPVILCFQSSPGPEAGAQNFCSSSLFLRLEFSAGMALKSLLMVL